MSNLKAVIVDVSTLPKGYVVTVLKEGEAAEQTATFSEEVWSGEHPPRVGQQVNLTNVSKFPKGWRAEKAAPITPENSTQHQEQSTQNTAS